MTPQIDLLLENHVECVSAYRNDFFLTYRMFMTPPELVEAILLRCESHLPFSNPAPVMTSQCRFYEAEGSSQAEEKRSSALRVISDWLSLVPFDFLEIDMPAIWDLFGCEDEIFRSISDEWIAEARQQNTAFVRTNF